MLAVALDPSEGLCLVLDRITGLLLLTPVGQFLPTCSIAVSRLLALVCGPVSCSLTVGFRAIGLFLKPRESLRSAIGLPVNLGLQLILLCQNPLVIPLIYLGYEPACRLAIRPDQS